MAEIAETEARECCGCRESMWLQHKQLTEKKKKIDTKSCWPQINPSIRHQLDS
ncbi:hypothetical protein JOB18_012408 [Solea senegalensis]|uniref:Uncharacterized protein n=1 Tax=Solea senegalensis TaxID=28829 RepID=A0AAV6SL41_SOLSE|nr:hypothetical protein JOB18_012408 [Solea senegalensis]